MNRVCGLYRACGLWQWTDDGVYAAYSEHASGMRLQWTDNLSLRKQTERDGSISNLVAKAALNLGMFPLASALTEACWEFCSVRKIKRSCILNSTLMFVLQIWGRGVGWGGWWIFHFPAVCEFQLPQCSASSYQVRQLICYLAVITVITGYCIVITWNLGNIWSSFRAVFRVQLRVHGEALTFFFSAELNNL